MFKNKNKGFTIIELIVVIAIIGVLAGIVAVNVNNYLKKSRDARRKTDISQLMAALELYYIERGEYPISGGASSPNSLWSNSGDTSWNTLQTALNGYITLPKDPINNTTGWAGGEQYNYDYYSRNYGCQQQWYMLVYKLENPDIISPGVRPCNGSFQNYPGTITIGKCAGCQ